MVALGIESETGNDFKMEKEKEKHISYTSQGMMPRSMGMFFLEEQVKFDVPPHLLPYFPGERDKFSQIGILIPRKSPVDADEKAHGKSVGCQKMNKPHDRHNGNLISKRGGQKGMPYIKSGNGEDDYTKNIQPMGKAHWPFPDIYPFDHFYPPIEPALLSVHAGGHPLSE